MRRYLFAIIIILVAILILPANWLDNLRNQGRFVVSPVTGAFYQTQKILKSPFRWLAEISEVREENTKLKNRIGELSNQLIELENLKRENKVLRSELELRPKIESFQRVVAQVVSYSNPALEQLLVINQGEKSGIHQGDAVIAQGYLVGKVTKTFKQSANVLLITSPNSLIQARLIQTGEKGIVIGDLTGIHLSDLPITSQVESKFLVETSGLGGSIPAGILIGETAKTRSGEQDPNLSVRIHSNVDFANLDIVFVLIKSQ